MGSCCSDLAGVEAQPTARDGAWRDRAPHSGSRPRPSRAPRPWAVPGRSGPARRTCHRTAMAFDPEHDLTEALCVRCRGDPRRALRRLCAARRRPRLPAAMEPRSQDGTDAPMAFGKTLDYRDERMVGDIKYLWETNRHLELVTLAQAWALTGEPRYAEGCRALLESWFEQCPYPLGPELDQLARARHPPDELVGGLAAARRGRLAVLQRHVRLRIQPAVARSHLSALPFHRRPLLALLVGEQPPARRVHGAVRRLADVAAVAAERALARDWRGVDSRRRH